MTDNKLTPEEKSVIIHKGTEAPFSGKLLYNKQPGTYHCKQCNAPLYRSEHKFDSQCGWPSFDDELEGAVRRTKDKDGIRTEITCAKCGAHLGHIFEGERLTEKNIRHCVNSISMKFVPKKEETKKAIFASGCFWGTEYFMQKAKGVIDTRSGFIGGTVISPSYKDVCSGTTGHREAVEVVYDPKITSFEKLAKLFFETHDPTQTNGQGPDIGDQYKSAIYYLDGDQKQITEKLISILKSKGLEVVTELIKASEFYEAEGSHQDYYLKTGKTPYCHVYTKRFD